MTFGHVWHLCTTTRYTRLLEAENERLRARLADYERALLPRVTRSLTAGEIAQVSAERHSRPKDQAHSEKPLRFARAGWGAVKNRLEDMTDPSIRVEQVLKANDI